jgi:hypothetical protein
MFESEALRALVPKNPNAPATVATDIWYDEQQELFTCKLTSDLATDVKAFSDASGRTLKYGSLCLCLQDGKVYTWDGSAFIAVGV